MIIYDISVFWLRQEKDLILDKSTDQNINFLKLYAGG